MNYQNYNKWIEWQEKHPNKLDPAPTMTYQGKEISLLKGVFNEYGYPEDRSGKKFSDKEILTESEKAAADKYGRQEIPTATASIEQFETKKVDWLIDGYIPKNQITIIGGDGGSGKTSIWCSLVAAFSTGRASIFEEYIAGDVVKDPERKVLFFSSEDTISEVLKPRISKYKANFKNISTIPLDDKRFKEIKFDSDFLEALIRDNRPDVVLFDPLQSFLRDDVIMGSRNQMRNMLNPLIRICQEYETTAIVICHSNKGKNVYGRKRLADSGDIWDIARSVFICGNADNETFYLSHEKNNYGARQKTLLYTLDKGRVNVKGFSDKRDYDFVIGEETHGKGAPALEEAKVFILEQLHTNNNSMLVKDLEEAADVMGISKATLKRARKALKESDVISVEHNGFGEKATWIVSIKPIQSQNMSGK